MSKRLVYHKGGRADSHGPRGRGAGGRGGGGGRMEGEGREGGRAGGAGGRRGGGAGRWRGVAIRDGALKQIIHNNKNATQNKTNFELKTVSNEKVIGLAKFRTLVEQLIRHRTHRLTNKYDVFGGREERREQRTGGCRRERVGYPARRQKKHPPLLCPLVLFPPPLHPQQKPSPNRMGTQKGQTEGANRSPAEGAKQGGKLKDK